MFCYFQYLLFSITFKCTYILNLDKLFLINKISCLDIHKIYSRKKKNLSIKKTVNSVLFFKVYLLFSSHAIPDFDKINFLNNSNKSAISFHSCWFILSAFFLLMLFILQFFLNLRLIFISMIYKYIPILKNTIFVGE